MINKDYYYLPIKYIRLYGANLAFFIVLLHEKYEYCKENGELTQDGYFPVTNIDIMIASGFTNSQILKLKNEAVEKELILTKKAGIPRKTYYKLNFLKIKEIINS